MPQSAAPLAPWSPPVQGRPVTLPAFEAPVAPPPVEMKSDAPAVESIPAVSPAVATPPVQANPFAVSARPAVADKPAQQNPFVQSTSQVERSAVPSPFAPPPNPIAAPVPAPPIDVAPVAQPVTASLPVSSPIAPPAVTFPVASEATAPVAAAAHASPVAPPVAASHPVRPGYFGPSAPAEDANPVVRPEPGYVSPIPPRVEERLAATPVPPKVAESALVTSSASDVDPANASSFVPPVAASPAHLQWPRKEPQAPSVESKPSDEPVGPLESTPARTLESTSTADAPVAEPAVVEARAQANSFETAPTELAASETPIAQADTPVTTEPANAERGTSDVASEGSASAPDAVAVRASEETSGPSNPESVVMEAEIQDHAMTAAQTFPAPRPFTSSGSEMPVVITTPPPPRAQDTAAPSAKLFDLGHELLPKAEAWSRKNLKATPRSMVIAAPLIALLGIWAVRGLASHPKHAAVADTAPSVVAEVAAATPAPDTANANASAASSAILVATSSAAPAPPPAADAAELASAVSHGLPALEALAQKFPSDPQVSIALASQQAQAQRFEAAVASIERAIVQDQKSVQNGKVMGILWRAAQSSATEPSFSALRKLGAKGADIAFDLATTAGVRDSVRERAKSELKSLPSDASADTRVATDLLLASDCNARKALLPRAESEGGKRTRSLLEQYSRGSACVSNTDQACNACLTGSPALTHALAQLNAGGSK